jgi:hypothetical protein
MFISNCGECGAIVLPLREFGKYLFQIVVNGDTEVASTRVWEAFQMGNDFGDP